MLCLWVQTRDSCDLGGVSDGSRLAVYQPSQSSSLLLSFSGMCFVLLFRSSCRFGFGFGFGFGFCFHALVVALLCRLDVPLIFSCPADNVPDWQPRILLGIAEARSVNVKNTHTSRYDRRGFLIHGMGSMNTNTF